MTNRSTRRKWSPARKLELVLESLQSDTQLAELCRREGLSPNRIYQWRKQLLGSAEAIFGPRPSKNGPDPQARKLSAENTRMKDVIVEITAENLDLKKRSRIERSPATAAGVAARGDELGRTDATTQWLAGTSHAGDVGDRCGHVLSLAPLSPRGGWRGSGAPRLAV